jgi:hypothetical protein
LRCALCGSMAKTHFPLPFPSRHFSMFSYRFSTRVPIYSRVSSRHRTLETQQFSSDITVEAPLARCLLVAAPTIPPQVSSSSTCGGRGHYADEISVDGVCIWHNTFNTRDEASHIRYCGVEVWCAARRHELLGCRVSARSQVFLCSRILCHIWMCSATARGSGEYPFLRWASVSWHKGGEIILKMWNTGAEEGE